MEPWLGDVVKCPTTSCIVRVWVSFGEVAQPMIWSSIDSWCDPQSLPFELTSPLSSNPNVVETSTIWWESILGAKEDRGVGLLLGWGLLCKEER